MQAIENYFMQNEEPISSCLLAMRNIILKTDANITEAWKYGMPFYCYHGKMFCYLWVHRKHLQPYLGIVEGRRIDHPLLLTEKRARMKILLIDPNEDIPINTVNSLLQQMIALYQ